MLKDYKKGDRVIVTEVDEFQIKRYNYDVGSTGVINEDSENCDCMAPFIWFDDEKSNYTSKGTAVSIYELKFI